MDEFKDKDILKIVQGPRDRDFQGLSYGCLVGKQLDKDKDWNPNPNPI